MSKERAYMFINLYVRIYFLIIFWKVTKVTILTHAGNNKVYRLYNWEIIAMSNRIMYITNNYLAQKEGGEFLDVINPFSWANDGRYIRWINFRDVVNASIRNQLKS